MWAKIEVYNYGTFLGSFYKHNDYLQTRQDIVKAVNEEYGAGNWTKWNLEY